MDFTNCLNYFYEHIDKSLYQIQEDLDDDIIQLSEVHRTPKITRTSLMEGKFIDSTIKSHILHNETYLNAFKIHYLCKNINICLEFRGNESDLQFIRQNPNHWISGLLIISLLYDMSEKAKVRHHFSDIKVMIYLTPYKKKLPSKGKILDAFSVNTGVTQMHSKKGEILIYRKEEWFKTLIHECLHLLGVHNNTFQDKKTKTRLMNIFPIKSNMEYEEAYVDCWAILLQCMILEFPRSDTFIQFKENVLFSIQQEIEHSLIQCNKVLKHMFLHYNALIKVPETKNIDKDKDNSMSYIRDMMYSEDTNVFCYYILKCILIFHFPNFISFCMNENDEILFLRKNSELYVLIELLHNKKDFVDTLYDYMNNNDYYKKTSLRMSNLKDIS
jgi:hypothetical protein